VATDTNRQPAPSAPEAGSFPWNAILALKGKTLTTLAWRREFTVIDVGDHLVRIRVKETRRVKDVGKAQLERTLAELENRGALSLQEVRAHAPDTSSYVAALLIAVPGVTWDEGKLRIVPNAAAADPSPRTTTKAPRLRSGAREGEVSFQATWTQQGSEALRSWRKLRPDVQRQIAALAMSEAVFLVREVQTCESVPEQLLASRLLWEARSISVVEDFEICPQHHIPTRDGVFRVDFLVKGNVGGTPVTLVVECDGHAYHDKTKEQAAHDRQRERSLRVAGYQVARFTASEISADPEDCALEVFRQMLAVARAIGAPEGLPPTTDPPAPAIGR
jgi:very-short-patch-repair endonuclease